MTFYSVRVSATAINQIHMLPRRDQRRVLRFIKQLREEPAPSGSRKIRGHDDVYRARVGPYRIIYCIEPHRLAVLLVGSSDRGDVYR